MKPGWPLSLQEYAEDDTVFIRHQHYSVYIWVTIFTSVNIESLAVMERLNFYFNMDQKRRNSKSYLIKVYHQDWTKFIQQHMLQERMFIYFNWECISCISSSGFFLVATTLFNDNCNFLLSILFFCVSLVSLSGSFLAACIVLWAAFNLATILSVTSTFVTPPALSVPSKTKRWATTMDSSMLSTRMSPLTENPLSTRALPWDRIRTMHTTLSRSMKTLELNIQA